MLSEHEVKEIESRYNTLRENCQRHTFMELKYNMICLTELKPENRPEYNVSGLEMCISQHKALMSPMVNEMKFDALLLLDDEFFNGMKLLINSNGFKGGVW